MCFEEIFGEYIKILSSDLHNIMSDVHTILLWTIDQTKRRKTKTVEPVESNKPETEVINKDATKAS